MSFFSVTNIRRVFKLIIIVYIITVMQGCSNINDIGISMIGQTAEICPADKKMYALRDVTSTVGSIPLICGSIMSKKIAEGIQGLVMDVKIGNGAFMETLEEGQKLATLLQQIGNNFNVATDIVFSSMDFTCFLDSCLITF